MQNKRTVIHKTFDHFATKVTLFLGTSEAFSTAFTFVLIWIIAGPFLNFSTAWVDIINTITRIFTFLMVFLIQRMQNKGILAVQLKLNELLAASKESHKGMIDIEDLTKEDLDKLHDYYVKIAQDKKNR